MASTSSTYAYTQGNRHGESSRSYAFSGEQVRGTLAQASRSSRYHPTGLREHPPALLPGPAAHRRQASERARDDREFAPRQHTKPQHKSSNIYRKPVPSASPPPLEATRAQQEFRRHATHGERSGARGELPPRDHIAPHLQQNAHPQPDQRAPRMYPRMPHTVRCPETPLFPSPSRPVKAPHSNHSAAMEGAVHEAQSNMRMLKQGASNAATNASNTMRNAFEIAPDSFERVIEAAGEIVDTLPEAFEEAYDDFRAFANALPGKTHKQAVKAWRVYRRARELVAKHGIALRAAIHAYRNGLRAAVPMRTAMVAEASGRSRSVRGRDAM